jgi:hypothetical protein
MNTLKTLALLGAVAAASSAMANTITPQALITGPVWTYGADLTSGEIVAGDGFTIFDFGGYVSGSITAPAGWVASTSVTGSPWGLAPLGPDTSEINLAWTYTGPTIQVVVGALPFGPFTAATTSTEIVTDNWVSRDHLLGNSTIVGDGALGPGDRANIIVPAAVPDGGATAMLLGVGILGLSALLLKK